MEISHPRDHASASSNQKTTTFNDLPEDVILCLMSKLSLRDVLNFSVVSKRWIHVPSCLEKIVFDSNMFKDEIQPKDAVVTGVYQFLKYYHKIRSTVATPLSLFELFICLCLYRESYGDLDAWISFAFSNSVTYLCVSLERECHQETRAIRPPPRDEEKYIFPWKLLDKPLIVLERLYLGSCIFECHLTSVWTSLVILQLFDTVLTQHDMERIRHCFPNLKYITLRMCKVPAKVTFAGGPLSYLLVMYCTNLEEIEVLDAGMLQEFSCRGVRVRFNLNNPHQLTKITFNILNSGADYIFQNLHQDFPAMRSLSIYSDRITMPPLEHLYGRMYSLLQLQDLNLYIHTYSGFSLRIMVELLKACPVLRRLEMVPPCMVDGVNGSDSTLHHLHKCLEFIKLSGFCGSPVNVELAKFMVQVSAESLVRLVIKREVELWCYNFSGHCMNWHGQQEYEVIQETLRNLMKRGDLVFWETNNDPFFY